MGVKINDTGEFPATTPAATDRVLGIDVSNTTNDANGEVVTFTVEDLRNANAYATAAQGAKADTAVQPAAIADFEDTTALDARDTANRSRANHTGAQAQSTITDLVADLAAKAPLASPALTGSPTAPTQTASDNSTKIATTAYVDAAAGGGGGGLVPISKTTASSDAAIDIDLTGGYNAYMVRLTGVYPSTDAQTLNLRTSTDGGTSFDSGASDYKWTYIQIATAFSQSDDTADSEITMVPQMGGAAGESTDGTVWIFPADGTNRTRVIFHYVYDQKDSLLAGMWGVGHRLDATAVDAVRFLCSSGNINGDFHLYGVADGA